MNRDVRRFLNAVKEAERPISGAELAKRYHVSRQVIVQDIACSGRQITAFLDEQRLHVYLPTDFHAS